MPAVFLLVPFRMDWPMGKLWAVRTGARSFPAGHFFSKQDEKCGHELVFLSVFVSNELTNRETDGTNYLEFCLISFQVNGPIGKLRAPSIPLSIDRSLYKHPTVCAWCPPGRTSTPLSALTFRLRP